MNINKKVSFWLSLIFVISTGFFYFCKNSHPTISEILIAILTGSFVSMVISIINYLHEKEEFLNNLFYRGAFIYSYLEQIKQLVININETSNLKYAINSLVGYSSSLDDLITNINFANYSPINLYSKEYKTANYVQGLYTIIQQYIIFSINIINKLNLDIDLKRLINLPTHEIEKLQKQIKDEINTLKKNVENIQADYLKNMNDLHTITTNKIRWKDTIKAIDKFTPENVKEYVKTSINQH